MADRDHVSGRVDSPRLGSCDDEPMRQRQTAGEGTGRAPQGVAPTSPAQEILPRQQTAADVVASVIDTYRAEGVPLAPRYTGIIGKHAKELLGAGFEFAVVAQAALIAVRRGEPHNVQHIAQDIALGKLRLTRREYERQLQDEREVGE